MDARQLLIDYKKTKEKYVDLAEKYVHMLEYQQDERARELSKDIILVSNDLNDIAKKFTEQFIF
jgi:hypothetical protein